MISEEWITKFVERILGDIPVFVWQAWEETRDT
jgi:hypothetical protein